MRSQSKTYLFKKPYLAVNIYMLQAFCYHAVGSIYIPVEGCL